MAIQDYGFFGPTEAAYADPGAYGTAIRGEALKKAEYLSKMDQFYAELEEVTREFEKTLSFKEKTLASEEKRFEESLGWEKEKFGETLDWEKERFGEEFGLKTKEFEWEKERFGEEFGLKKAELAGQQAKELFPYSWAEEQKKQQESRWIDLTSPMFPKGGYKYYAPEAGDLFRNLMKSAYSEMGV